VFTRDGATGSYRPGSEADAGAGLTYDLGKAAVFDRIAPVLQLLGSWRVRDSGTAASLNSGCRRLLIAPGVNVRIDNKARIFLDAEVPVLQYVKPTCRPPGMWGS